METTQYNPYLLPKIERPVFTDTFESADFPGQFLTISLRKLCGPDNALVAARSNDAYTLHITGENPLCVDGNPLEFPGLDSDEWERLKSIELEGGGILQNCASLEVMQPEENRQSLEFFVGICFRDQSMWNQLNRFGLDVNAGKVKKPKAGEEQPAAQTKRSGRSSTG